jgi:Zn-dependent protease with chaperone function
MSLNYVFSFLTPAQNAFITIKSAFFQFPLLRAGSIIQRNEPEYEQACEQLLGNRIKQDMAQFLRDRGIRKDVVFSEQDNIGICAALGTNKLKSSQGVVLIAPGFFDADKEACKFVVKHEIAHLKNNDCLHINVIKTIISIASAILGVVCFKPLKSLLFVDLTSIAVDSILWQWRERKADEFAIKYGSNEELLGGLRFFKTLQKVNCQLREEKGVLHKILISNKGEVRLDLRHPSLESRCKKIEKALRARNVVLPSETEDLSSLQRVLYNSMKAAEDLDKRGRIY